MHDTAFVNANLATMREGAPYGAIKDGVIAVAENRISWVGARGDWRGKAREEHDARGAWITPGLVDCHTHLVYAGNRAHEFELRLKGATYEEIARAGGGILSTVKATRAATEEELVGISQKRLRRWQEEGATVIEVKSGYGLDRDTELRMLRAARRLSGLTVKTTFLGAHALPPEYKGRADEYIGFVCDEVLPEIKKQDLADAVDAFCERIAFTPEQTRRVFEKAKALGLPVKLHADQLSDLGGAALAARHAALSADH
ncbi:MAG TPA: imidazolonepropionase, partial [Burkholderiales bacterium]|nr:imidazolonepropionase [Burkholderiales bacterium]